jgi:membrane protease YdiL (CAAX protease family)
VGFLVRRDFRETLVRLGYGPVSARQLALVPPFVAAALAFAFASDWLFVRLQPVLSDQVNEVSQGLFSTSGMSLFSAILFGLLIGIGAAAGEETLFRGAVQPALGITLTSLLFASVHTQYGLSIILVHIFLLSVGLGLLRKYANTTLAFITHATYNFTLVLLSYFFGI